MKQALKHAAAFGVIAIIAMMNAGCKNTHDDHPGHRDGTHRMGTPKENYQMSNEQMPGHRKTRKTTSQTEGSGTHRMGTPKENYQMSNEQMRR